MIEGACTYPLPRGESGEPLLVNSIRELLGTSSVVRDDPSIQNTRRFLAADAVIAGHAMRADDAVLVVLAYASPPDPWWVPGLYDGADFDDVVALVTSATAIVGPAAPGVPRLVPPVIVPGALRDDARLPCFVASTLHARAPPSS